MSLGEERHEFSYLADPGVGFETSSRWRLFRYTPESSILCHEKSVLQGGSCYFFTLGPKMICGVDLNPIENADEPSSSQMRSTELKLTGRPNE